MNVVRQYGGTIFGGLAIGGAVGVGASWYTQQTRQQVPQTPHYLSVEELAEKARAEAANSKAKTAEAIEKSLNLPPRQEVGEGSDRLARWRERWATNNLGWQLEKPHPQLVKHLEALLPEEEKGKFVLFPLCGASVDLGYLARRGHHVVGVDGVPEAIDRLFKDWGEEIPSGGALAPGAPHLRVATPAWWQRVAAEQMSKAAGRLPAEEGSTVQPRVGADGQAKPPLPPFEPAQFLFGMQGDFLDFGAEVASNYGLGNFDAAFDRGGLVAVRPEDRPKYAANLKELLSPGGRLLLVAVEHEPSFGPPHSLSEVEVRALLGDAFEIKQLGREDKMKVEPHWQKQRGATSFDEVTYMCVRK